MTTLTDFKSVLTLESNITINIAYIVNLCLHIMFIIYTYWDGLTASFFVCL